MVAVLERMLRSKRSTYLELANDTTDEIAPTWRQDGKTKPFFLHPHLLYLVNSQKERAATEADLSDPA